MKRKNPENIYSSLNQTLETFKKTTLNRIKKYFIEEFLFKIYVTQNSEENFLKGKFKPFIIEIFRVALNFMSNRTMKINPLDNIL